MLMVVQGATPPIASTVVVPERLPPGFVPIATATLPAKPGTVLPCASRAVTCTAGAIVAPAVVVLGCTVKASCAAAPAAIVKAALVEPETPGAVAESR